jgi:predicted Fe-Mo cluster-binding NifX family protein
MKFCPVVPEIFRGQIHGSRKERRKRIRIIIIIIRNGAKTISLPNIGRLNYLFLSSFYIANIQM